jgi:ribonuclease-3
MPGEARRRRIRALLRAFDIDLEPIAVEPAFVHESAAREGAGPSNERLELLGDAILGFVTVRWLFERYPNASEGELARRKHALVSGDACAQTAKRLGFGDLLLLGHGAASSGGAENSSILADSFEAFIAAVVRASDLGAGAAFIEREHLAHVERDEQAFADAKTALQEYTQGRYGFAPTYYERSEGPPHERRFTSVVKIGEEAMGEGIGSSKKAAQTSAAGLALAKLRARDGPPPPPQDPVPPSDPRVIDLSTRTKSSRPRRPRTKV